MHRPGLRPGGQEPGRPWKFCLLFLGSSQGLDLVPTRAAPGPFSAAGKGRGAMSTQPLLYPLSRAEAGECGWSDLPPSHASCTHPPRGTGSLPSPKYLVLQLLPHDLSYSSHKLLDGSVWLHCTREAQRGSVIPKGHTAVEQRGAESWVDMGSASEKADFDSQY